MEIAEEKNAGFSPGDQAALKSGGPLMTVQSIEFYPTGKGTKTPVIRCVWFNESNELEREDFVPATLRKKKDTSNG